jgi:nitrite reductase/ring-hydroxylating ferredoxin subunit
MSGISKSTMAETGSVWARVAGPGEPREGATQYVALPGNVRILLLRRGGRVYATQGLCGHMRFPLGDAKLEGTVVTCPLHKAQFDLTSGAVVRGPHVPALFMITRMGKGMAAVPAESLRRYETEERADGIYIR